MLRGTLSSLALILLGSVLATQVGCETYRGPHGLQNTPSITRLDTIPRGARVHIERLNLRLGKTTPIDLPGGLHKKDVISVTLDGYQPWKGPLGEIPTSARGTYELLLEPLAPAE
jgi:hypothetical protein